MCGGGGLENGSIEVQPICAMNKESFAIRVARLTSWSDQSCVGWWTICRALEEVATNVITFCVGEIAWSVSGGGRVEVVELQSRRDKKAQRSE